MSSGVVTRGKAYVLCVAHVCMHERAHKQLRPDAAVANGYKRILMRNIPRSSCAVLRTQVWLVRNVYAYGKMPENPIAQG